MLHLLSVTRANLTMIIAHADVFNHFWRSFTGKMHPTNSVILTASRYDTLSNLASVSFYMGFKKLGECFSTIFFKFHEDQILTSSLRDSFFEVRPCFHRSFFLEKSRILDSNLRHTFKVNFIYAYAVVRASNSLQIQARAQTEVQIAKLLVILLEYSPC